jgi:hypothetical protein
MSGTIVTGVAALFGGAALFLKAAVILMTGNQPPLLFEVAPAFLAVGLFGLVSRALTGKAKTGGRTVVAVIFGAALVGLVLPDYGEAVSSATEVVAGLLPTAVLISTGVLMRRRSVWAWPWRDLPFILGASIIPSVIVGAILETALGERYLEIPLLAVSVGWMLLGYRLALDARSSIP